MWIRLRCSTRTARASNNNSIVLAAAKRPVLPVQYGVMIKYRQWFILAQGCDKLSQPFFFFLISEYMHYRQQAQARGRRDSGGSRPQARTMENGATLCRIDTRCSGETLCHIDKLSRTVWISLHVSATGALAPGPERISPRILDPS